MVTVASMQTTFPNSDEVQRGGRLVSTDGRVLPLIQTRLEVEAGGGIARTVVHQCFANPTDRPLRVNYLLPLPADGAVDGFAFTLAGKRVVGEVQSKERARQTFEAALIQGRTATLLEEERSSLFNQEIGNLPPGEELWIEVHVDQPLMWRHEGLWEWRFPTVVGARYHGSPGRVADANRVAVDIADKPLPVTTHVSLQLSDRLEEGGVVESPSHRLKVRGRKVELAKDARLDRDVVVRWPVMAPEVGLSIRTHRPKGHESAYGLVTLVPPEVPKSTHRRELVLLLDTSGSMHGQPLDQCRHVASALIESLNEGDSLEMVEFSSRPQHYRKDAVLINAKEQQAALQWIAGLAAGGGTEMVSGIKAALKAAAYGAQKQIILMTDGYIGFESEVIGKLQADLPRGTRVHTVGVGNAVNRTLTQGVARAGGGLEVIIGVGEDAERAADELTARTAQPVLTDLEVRGSAVVKVVPARAPDLYAKAPAKLAFELKPEGGTIEIEGVTPEGRFVKEIQVAPTAVGEGLAAVSALFARESVADIQTRRQAGLPESFTREQITELGLRFQIATKYTSWVAVSESSTVDPGTPIELVRMPHEAVDGVSLAGQGFGAAPRMMSKRRARGGGGGDELARGAPPPPAAPRPASAPVAHRPSPLRQLKSTPDEAEDFGFDETTDAGQEVLRAESALGAPVADDEADYMSGFEEGTEDLELLSDIDAESDADDPVVASRLAPPEEVVEERAPPKKAEFARQPAPEPEAEPLREQVAEEVVQQMPSQPALGSVGSAAPETEEASEPAAEAKVVVKKDAAKSKAAVRRNRILLALAIAFILIVLGIWIGRTAG